MATPPMPKLTSAPNPKKKAKAKPRTASKPVRPYLGETIKETPQKAKQTEEAIKKTKKAAERRAKQAAKKAAEQAAKRGATRAAAKRAAVAAAKRAALAAGLKLSAASASALTGAALVGYGIYDTKRKDAETTARAKKLAAQDKAKTVKVPAGRSPTDIMRQTGKGRQVLAGPKVKPAAPKAAAKPKVMPRPAAPKATAPKTGQSFNQAFKEARAKFDAGVGNTTFKYQGKSYSVAKPAELKAAGGEYGPELTKLLKAKQRRSETAKQVGSGPKAKAPSNTGPRAKMLNRLEREKAAKKSYGGGMKKKAARRKTGGKIKGVGCAQRGYGKAMR